METRVVSAKKVKSQRTVPAKLLVMGLDTVLEILGSVNLIPGAKDVLNASGKV